jgi:membrane protease YdiL (CAAX protease family)
MIASASAQYLSLLGWALSGAAGLKALGLPVPLTALTACGALALGAAKLLQEPSGADRRVFRLSPVSARARRLSTRFLPTITALLGRADDALEAHARFEAEVGVGSVPAFRRWLLSGLRAAAYWVPVCLLAMLAGAAVASPLKLAGGGLGLAETETGRWLLRQSWPRLAGRVAAVDALGQLFLMSGFDGLSAAFRRGGFRKDDPEFAAAAVLTACLLSYLRVEGFAWMQAAPMLAIQLALFYAYARARTRLVPCAANVAMGLASLYSARMVVLLKADLGSVDSLPGIPGGRGVLAVLAASLALFALSAALRFGAAPGRNFLSAAARDEWARLRATGLRWSAPSELPKTPLSVVPVGLLWGVAVYLASYAAYYAAYALVPTEEVVPAVLKQTLLMPLDMLVYLFIIGAALEELIFRKGLFKALRERLGTEEPGAGLWPAAVVSAAVFSAFHFVDFGVVLRFLGVNASRLIQSMLVVYGFSWAGFTARVAAGVLLALLYDQAGILLIPVVAHFTSNLLEAIGLRWGLSWFLAAVAGIFALQLLERRPRRPSGQ